MFLRLRSNLIFLFILKNVQMNERENTTTYLPIGFYCLHCHNFVDGKEPTPYASQTGDSCAQPFEIFCPSDEAIGCLKYVRLSGYRVEIYRDCFRFTLMRKLMINDLQCHSFLIPPTHPSTDRAFCCNNGDLCNESNSIFSFWNIKILLIIHFFLLILFNEGIFVDFR